MGDQLEAAMSNHKDRDPGLEAAIGLSDDHRAAIAAMTDRDLLERIHTQLGYLVDTLAPHGQVMRSLDLVADAYGPSGPLFGRLDHADVQAHTILGRLDDLAALGPKLDRLDRFITDNQDLIERGKKMMGTTDALRAAMPGGHRRRGK